MIRLSPLLALSLLALPLSSQAAQDTLPAESIVTDSRQIASDYGKWAATQPRKESIRTLTSEELPEGLRKLGYKSAFVENGWVILISSDEGDSVIHGIAVMTDGRDRTGLLQDFGWKVSDSSDPRIKILKRVVSSPKKKTAGSDDDHPLNGRPF